MADAPGTDAVTPRAAAPTTTHSLTSSETHTDSLRALDAANQTCKQKERHGEKVHNVKASKPPGVACCRTGSRARSCGGQAVVSLALLAGGREGVSS